MNNTSALFFIELYANRCHEALAFTRSVTGNVLVDMQRKQTIRAVIPAAAPLVRFYNPFTVGALKALVRLDHVFSYVHQIC
jgi:hypothetical protein